MAKDQGKKYEEKLEFTPEGEALGYIGLDQAQVRVLRGLGLGAAEVIPHRPRQVSCLRQNAKFPVWNIVQENPGWQDVIGHVTAAFVEQHSDGPDQGNGSGVPGDDLVTMLLGMYGRSCNGIKKRGLVIQPEHHHGADQKQCQRNANPQYPGSSVVHRN